MLLDAATCFWKPWQAIQQADLVIFMIPVCIMEFKYCQNKWRWVTISLRTGGQGHPTPSLTPTTPPNTLTHKQYQLQHQKYAFFAFSTRTWQLERDGRTNGPTNGRTDKASYRVAWPQLKNEKMKQWKDKTSDAGSQYHCAWVGGGGQPPSTPNSPPTH